MAAPIGRAMKPTKLEPKASRMPVLGSVWGTNCELSTSAAAMPYRKKSYHSIDVPIVEAITARWSCARVTCCSACIPPILPAECVQPKTVSAGWNQGKQDRRGVAGIVDDRLLGAAQLGVGADRMARVGVAIPPRETARGDLQANAVAGLEDVA